MGIRSRNNLCLTIHFFCIFNKFCIATDTFIYNPQIDLLTDWVVSFWNIIAYRVDVFSNMTNEFNI